MIHLMYQVSYADTLKISLAVKKALVDRELLDVTQVPLHPFCLARR